MKINLVFNETYVYPNLEIPDNLYELNEVLLKLKLTLIAKELLDNFNERNDTGESLIKVYNNILEYSIKGYEQLEKYEECRILLDLKRIVEPINREEFNKIVNEG